MQNLTNGSKTIGTRPREMWIGGRANIDDTKIKLQNASFGGQQLHPKLGKGKCANAKPTGSV